MPGIVNNMLSAKLSRMIGTGAYRGRLAGKLAVNAVMISIVSD